MTDLSPEEQRLLPLATIEALRERAKLRGFMYLQWPMPECHECGAPITGCTTYQNHADGTGSITVNPCEHSMSLGIARMEAIVREARNVADQQTQEQP